MGSKRVAAMGSKKARRREWQKCWKRWKKGDITGASPEFLQKVVAQDPEETQRRFEKMHQLHAEKQQKMEGKRKDAMLSVLRLRSFSCAPPDRELLSEPVKGILDTYEQALAQCTKIEGFRNLAALSSLRLYPDGHLLEPGPICQVQDDLEQLMAPRRAAAATAERAQATLENLIAPKEEAWRQKRASSDLQEVPEARPRKAKELPSSKQEVPSATKPSATTPAQEEVAKRDVADIVDLFLPVLLAFLGVRAIGPFRASTALVQTSAVLQYLVSKVDINRPDVASLYFIYKEVPLYPLSAWRAHVKKGKALKRDPSVVEASGCLLWLLRGLDRWLEFAPCGQRLWNELANSSSDYAKFACKLASR